MAPKQKRSAVWKHFEASVTGKKAKCRHCKVVISFEGGSNGNLTRHIRAKHPHITIVYEGAPRSERPEETVEQEELSSTSVEIKQQPWCEAQFELIDAERTDSEHMLDDPEEELETEFLEEEEVNSSQQVEPSSSKEVIRKRTGLSMGEKHILASQIKDHPLIWDPTNRQHTNSKALAYAWREIAVYLNRPVADCKVAWSFLLEGNRYRQKALQNKFVAGDDYWEFADDLTFLPDPTYKMKLVTSSSAIVEDSNSNYCYTRCCELDPAARTPQSICQTLANTKQTMYKYPEVWANLDRMIRKLNDDDKAEEIFMQFQTIAYEALKTTK